MDAFTEADRDRAIDTMRATESSSAKLDELRRGMHARLDTIERRQRTMARRMPTKTAKAIVDSLSKRAALLLGIGIMLGSALGGAAIELARRLIASALGVH